MDYISLEQFDIYKKYYGNGDLFARAASRKERDIMKDFDWHAFNVLLQDLYLVIKDQVSEEFKCQIVKTLNAVAVDPQLQESITGYAANLIDNEIS